MVTKDVLEWELFDAALGQECQIFIELNTRQDQLSKVSESMDRSPDVATLKLPWIGGAADDRRLVGHNDRNRDPTYAFLRGGRLSPESSPERFWPSWGDAFSSDMMKW